MLKLVNFSQLCIYFFSKISKKTINRELKNINHNISKLLLEQKLLTLQIRKKKVGTINLPYITRRKKKKLYIFSLKTSLT